VNRALLLRYRITEAAFWTKNQDLRKIRKLIRNPRQYVADMKILQPFRKKALAYESYKEAA